MELVAKPSCRKEVRSWRWSAHELAALLIQEVSAIEFGTVLFDFEGLWHWVHTGLV